jgi:hypothetical protein
MEARENPEGGMPLGVFVCPVQGLPIGDCGLPIVGRLCRRSAIGNPPKFGA